MWWSWRPKQLQKQAGVEGAAGKHLPFHALVANSRRNTCGTLFQLQTCQVSKSVHPILPQFHCLERTAVVLGLLVRHQEMQPRKEVLGDAAKQCYVAALLLILFPFACGHSCSFLSSPTLTQGYLGERCQPPLPSAPTFPSTPGLWDKTLGVLA